MNLQYSYHPFHTDTNQFYPQVPVNEVSMAGNSYVPFNPKKHIFNAPPKRSNALFIKNLPFNLTSEEFLKIFEQFGEIASVSLHIQKRGIAFVTYYDLRASESAKNKLQGFKVHDRFPAIDYSYKPPNYSKVDPREFSSLIKISQVPNSSSISKEDIEKSLSKYGEIFEINPKTDLSFLVLFYDSRCAHKACAKGFVEINNIKCQCEVYVENDNSVIYAPKPPSKIQNFMYNNHQFNYQNSYNYSPNYTQPIVSVSPAGSTPLYQPPSPPFSYENNHYQYQNPNNQPPYPQQQPFPPVNPVMAQNNSMVYQQPSTGNGYQINSQTQPVSVPSENLKETLMKLRTLLHK